MKKILNLIVLGSIFACDLSYCMQKGKSPYEQRLENRVKKWKENAEKADLMVSCIKNIKDDGTALVLQNLKIRKDGWSYEIHSDGTMYLDSEESPKPVLNKSGYYVIEKGSKKFSIGITPASSSQLWVDVEINEEDAKGDTKTINIGWKQKEGLLIVHGADLDGSCAFGGRYVHMVDGKETSSDGSKPNKFPGELTVFATHGFINFSPLYFKPDAIHIISPGSVNYGVMTNEFDTDYRMTPSLTRYTAFSAKYSDFLNNWVACHKGFHDFGKIDVAGSHVYLEDLPSYVSGSFAAQSITMNGENNFLQFGDCDFKNVMLDARNQYFDPTVHDNGSADYDSGRYKVEIDQLSGVEKVYLPTSWGYQQDNDNSLNINDTYAYVNVKNGVSNIEKMPHNLLSAGDSSKYFKNKLYWSTNEGARVVLDSVNKALKQGRYYSLDNETICTAGLYVDVEGRANGNPLSKDTILQAINTNGEFDCYLGVSGFRIKNIKCKITKTDNSNTINVCLNDSADDIELSDFGYDLCLNLIKRILNNDNSLKSPFYVMNNEGEGVYSGNVAGYLLGYNSESVGRCINDKSLKLKLGKTTVADREYLTEFKPLEKSDIMRNEFLARVYFDVGNEEANQNIYAMTIRCVIAPDGKVYAGEYRTGAPLTKDATVWLAESLSSLKGSEQENDFEERKSILEKALNRKGKGFANSFLGIHFKTEDGLKCENIVGEKCDISVNELSKIAADRRVYATILATPDNESKTIEIPVWLKMIGRMGNQDNYAFFDSTTGQPFDASTDKRLTKYIILGFVDNDFPNDDADQTGQPAVQPQEQPQPNTGEEEDKKDVAPQEQLQPSAEEEEDKKDVKSPQKSTPVKHFEVNGMKNQIRNGKVIRIDGF